jgi:hypothetical protein
MARFSMPIRLRCRPRRKATALLEFVTARVVGRTSHDNDGRMTVLLEDAERSFRQDER